MSHHLIDKARQESSIAQTIRFCLRAMGVFALTSCVLFWLTLLFQ